MNIFEITSKVFYHITLKKNVPSILKRGLIVSKGDRSGQLENQNAIYMFYDLDDTEDAVMNWLGAEFDKEEDLSLLEIILPENFPVYHDSSVGYEYYTTKNIPPEYIKVSNKLNLNETTFDKELSSDIKGSYIVPATKRGDEKIETLKVLLTKKGWVVAGQGYYSILFISPNRNNSILKVNRVRDPAYDHFVEVVKTHNNIHFPKITDKMKIGNGWYAYLMERLYPFEDKKQFEIISNGVRTLNIIKSDIVELSPDSSHMIALNKLKDNPTLYNAAKIIVENSNPFRTDISEENIMQRKDGTIVFSDVYAK